MKLQLDSDTESDSEYLISNLSVSYLFPVYLFNSYILFLQLKSSRCVNQLKGVRC